MKKFFPSGMFGLVVLAFVLPFVTIGCSMTQETMTFSGFKMMADTRIGDQVLQKDWHVIAAFVVALLGGVFSAMAAASLTSAGRTLGFWLAGVCGLASAVLLWWMKAALDRTVTQDGQGAFYVQQEVGFWLAVLGSVAAAALSFLHQQLFGQAEDT